MLLLTSNKDGQSFSDDQLQQGWPGLQTRRELFLFVWRKAAMVSKSQLGTFRHPRVRSLHSGLAEGSLQAPKTDWTSRSHPLVLPSCGRSLHGPSQHPLNYPPTHTHCAGNNAMTAQSTPHLPSSALPPCRACRTPPSPW